MFDVVDRRAIDVCVTTFAEPVDLHTRFGVKCLSAIWIERPLDVDLAGAVATEAVECALHLRASDLNDVPGYERLEELAGLEVYRHATAKTMRIVQPVRSDGHGMIVAALAFLRQDETFD